MWCDGKAARAVPAQPETVAAFLAAEAKRGMNPTTIGRRSAAIAKRTSLPAALQID
jgi:hypothetical protein